MCVNVEPPRLGEQHRRCDELGVANTELRSDTGGLSADRGLEVLEQFAGAFGQYRKRRTEFAGRALDVSFDAERAESRSMNLHSTEAVDDGPGVALSNGRSQSWRPLVALDRQPP